MAKRDKRIEIRVFNGEKEKLESLARTYNLKLSKFIREIPDIFENFQITIKNLNELLDEKDNEILKLK